MSTGWVVRPEQWEQGGARTVTCSPLDDGWLIKDPNVQPALALWWEKRIGKPFVIRLIAPDGTPASSKKYCDPVSGEGFSICMQRGGYIDFSDANLDAQGTYSVQTSLLLIDPQGLNLYVRNC